MPRRKLDKPELPVELKTPIAIPSERQSNPQEYINSERKKKLAILLKHYGAPPDTLSNYRDDPTRLLLLFFEIIYSCIDGFAIVHEKREGRRVVWTDCQKYRLWYEVLEKARLRDDSYLNVCRILSKNKPWRDLLNIKNNVQERQVKALYDQFLIAQKSTMVTFLSTL